MASPRALDPVILSARSKFIQAEPASRVGLIQALGRVGHMGINLQWEDERGAVLGEVADPESLTIRFVPHVTQSEFACLRFVDAVGDAVFNQAQLPILLSELERQLPSVSNLKAQEHLKRVISLVLEARGHVHTYLRFVGD
jgi:hypothetical protein